jgi:hypothetical protein
MCGRKPAWARVRAGVRTRVPANGLTNWPVEAALLGGWGGRLATASG